MGDDFQGFIDAVEDRSGCRDSTALQRAIRATLGVLGSHLDGVPTSLRTAIPRDLRGAIRAGRRHPSIGPAAFYLMISNEIGLRAGMALEVTHAVVNELADRLDEGSRARLRSMLPPAWAALVSPTASPTRAQQQRATAENRWAHLRARPQMG